MKLIQFIENEDERRIIWYRGNRLSWSKIGRLVGLERRKVKNKYSELLMVIIINIKLFVKPKEKDKIYKLISPKYE